jgi:hypothetical protein
MRIDCWLIAACLAMPLGTGCADHQGSGGANEAASDGEVAAGARTATSDNGAPELPRVLIDTKLPAPAAGGRRLMVQQGQDLQHAIDEARPGDVLLLEAGAEFDGSFTLPRKSGEGWVTIRSSAPDDSLPPEGTRITPAFSRLLPKLATTNGDPALRTADGAHHYRLIGLEITAAPRVTDNLVLVELGGDARRQRARAQVPHHLIIDRSYVHGHRALDFKRCVALNSAYTAIIDSYISECHSRGFDSQAIVGWNGPGPFKIVGNYLEAAGENVMFGGGDPGIDGLIPSDIEIRRNHIIKPLEWRGSWLVKNLLELKNAQRVLIEGNILENNWSGGQDGFAVVLMSVDQGGSAPWSVTRDVTFRNNKVLNAPGGLSVSVSTSNRAEAPSRILVQNNLFAGIGAAAPGDLGRLWELIDDPTDVTFEHNTGFAPTTLLMLDVLQKPFVTIRDNVVERGKYGIIGSGVGEGQRAVAYYLPHSVITHNVIIGTAEAPYPGGNFFPATTSDVGFVDASRGDYRLAKKSRYKSAGTDGRDPGADFATLDSVTAGVSSNATLKEVSAAARNR